jgi:hypothetical protein
MLQSLYEHCLKWARENGASFAPEKYILVHFTIARMKHGTICPLTLLLSTMSLALVLTRNSAGKNT